MHENEMAVRTKIAIDEALAEGFTETAMALRLLLESCEDEYQLLNSTRGHGARKVDLLRVE